MNWINLSGHLAGHHNILQEVMDIDQLSPIVKQLLKKFDERNKGLKPRRILFFRDGVSEGQFKQVRNRSIVSA